MSERNNLIKGFFITRPDDKLAAVDVYKPEGLSEATINSIKDFASSMGVSLDSVILGGQSAARLMPSVLNAAKGLKNTPILERISQAGNLSSLLTKGFSPSLQNTFKDLYQDYGDTILKVGDIAQRAISTNYKDLTSITDLINKFTGTDTVLFNDQDGVAALTLGLISEASQNGIPNVLGPMISGLDDQNLIMRVCEGSLPIAIETSDVNMLGTILDTVGVGNFNSLVPDSLAQFASNYVIGDSNLVQDLVSTYEDVKAIYDTAKGNWLGTFRMDGEEPILDASSVIGASEDFKEVFHQGLFETEDIDASFVYAAMQFPPESVKQSHERLLPFYVSRVTI